MVVLCNGVLCAAAFAGGVDGAGQGLALGVGDGQRLVEALLGGEGLVAFGDALVGEEARGFEVVEGPGVRAVMAGGDGVGVAFDGAVSGFAGAVVGRAGGR